MDVVGPICESGDFLAKDRELPAVPPGECVAVLSAGAYGFAMSSNYNSRPRAAEVLVRGDAYAVIRERESYEDLVRGEAGAPARSISGRRPPGEPGAAQEHRHGAPFLLEDERERQRLHPHRQPPRRRRGRTRARTWPGACASGASRSARTG